MKKLAENHIFIKFTIEIYKEMVYIYLCNSLFIFLREVLFYGS